MDNPIQELDTLNLIDYSEILNQINENILKTNEILGKIGDILESYKIAIFLLIFSMAIITALLIFKK